MSELTQFQENLRKVGFTSRNQILGFLYHTAAMPTLLSFINEDESIIKPLLPLIKNYKPKIEEVEWLDFDSLFFSAKIFKEYYLNSSIKSDDILYPKTEIVQGLIESETENKYEEFDSIENPYNTNLRMLRLLESLGDIISSYGDFSSNPLSVISIGYEHSNFWKNTPDGLCYTKSVTLSNVFPTYLADVMNTFPSPDANNSNPNLWLLSKEIFNRMHDEKYGLDLETKKWIWSIHNYIFYVNDPDRIELITKYQQDEGLNEMLSDIFKNIGGLSGNLKSSEFIYVHRYSNVDKWDVFINDVNRKVKDDFGISIKNIYSSRGEGYWYLSYRFINAVMLYLKKEKTKKGFKFW